MNLLAGCFSSASLMPQVQTGIGAKLRGSKTSWGFDEGTQERFAVLQTRGGNPMLRRANPAIAPTRSRSCLN
jgi:hypothetical protein